MPGPRAKDPTARRRSQPTPGFRQLPAEGRTGDPPAWPLSAADGDELALWADLWRYPQALEWERLRSELAVAMYVRTLIWMNEAADGQSEDAYRKFQAELRQLDDKIGLSPGSMSKLRWEIQSVEPEVETERIAARRIITEVS